MRRIASLQLASIFLAALIGLATLPSAFAVHRSVMHHAHRRHLRWARWNPMFRPSHESLLIQNAEIDRLDLPRIQDETELEALKADGSLLEIVPGEDLRIDPRLDPSRRYCRPWTLSFVDDLSQAFYDRFHQQIQVNSAVRTVKVQRKLRRHNRNAAPYEGDTASSHLAGVTVDLQRRGMSKDEIRWMEHYLFYMKALRLVEPEEERHQWVFHIMVSGRYAGWRETQSFFPVENPDQEKPETPATEVAAGSGSK
ncbi:MAG: DUF5715 family protein [Candidatus Sulfotelmatobacter sp.]